MFDIAGILPDTSATGGLGYFHKQLSRYKFNQITMITKKPYFRG